MLYCPQCVEVGFEPSLMPRRVLHNRSFSGKEKKRVIVLWLFFMSDGNLKRNWQIPCVQLCTCLMTKSKYELSVAEEFYPIKYL